MKCNNIQTRTKPQSTRLQLENKNTEGKRFRWKSNHVEMTKPICTILKVETTDKQDIDRMTAADFPATFSQFKEGSQPINEARALELLDVKVKTKEFNISNDDRPKMAKIGDYWSEEQTTEVVNLLREFQDVFARDYKYLKGLVHEMGEMNIDTKPDVRLILNLMFDLPYKLAHKYKEIVKK